MSIPRMNYPQYRKARKLTHECCNSCDGNCLLLDDVEECVCVQSISYSLLCRWFKVAVLPLDAALYAEISKSRDEVKRCANDITAVGMLKYLGRLHRNPTGPNTARIARCGCAGRKKPNGRGKDTSCLRI